MARCDDDRADDAASTGLLVLRAGGFDDAALGRLDDALDRMGFRRGPLVGPVLPVTGPTDALEALADDVQAAKQPLRPPGADAQLLDALAIVEQFAWDEGADTF